MHCDQLALRIQSLAPHLDAQQVARACLLMLMQTRDVSDLECDDQLKRQLRNVSYRVDSALDKYTEVCDELSDYGGGSPIAYSPEHIFTLVRAVQVQQQLLDFYTSVPALI
ncbi:MAG: hypothetical protein AAFP90_07145 [Planctomycetota bacterium]